MSAAPRTTQRLRLNLNVVHWAADECERQRSGERSVAYLLDAWCWAAARLGDGEQITEATIRHLGALAEPDKNNPERYRTEQVGTLDGKRFTPPESVPRLMAALVEALPSYADDPDDWYRQFEEIHPFVDGNGRVGALLWNWQRGTLAQPDTPPDFWRGSAS